MKNILVPIGTSPESHQTLQYAVDFATEFSSKVYVMEVFSASSRAGNLANVTEVVTKTTKEHLKEVISKVDAKNVDIKIATYNGELLDGIKAIDKELEIDLMIVAPRSNDIKESLYLGPASGKIVKKTNIPTLLVPKGTKFTPFKSVLTAFKSGIVKKKRTLTTLVALKDKFKPTINLLLVKTPGYKDEDLQVHPALMDISTQLSITENATTYQGVLEHFQAKHPDLLCVFRRKRGFFKKLWEKNIIPKSEFFAPIPVLVLRSKRS